MSTPSEVNPNLRSEIGSQDPFVNPHADHYDCGMCGDDDYDLDDGEEHRCMTCGGEGWEWCEDQNSSEGCWARDCDGTAHTCPNCDGSGLAKDQVWA